MEGLRIIPECYIDTCLTETITSCTNQFNHQKGCGTVSRIMQKKFGDDFAVGIIDKDKNEVAYMRDFELLASRESLFVYKHKSKLHYFIQISPAIEKFFLKAAAEKKLDIASYGLPSELNELTKRTKKVAGKDEEDFRRFKKLFRELADSSEMIRLSKLIQYMGNTSYKVDTEELQSILAK